ncbi:MAG: sigma-70 family RNA polymerase sigma factor [Candidatus Sungbacteria bacterium]|uniref:Sigma-70 family RNA polymerase sigma factor n=1 Tax=Candidatus Sungiibacteriota bacterium TaxID=2750080 RepID=A0A9D6LTZ9_9BACT|nr:sigma-70 family RNA polymerase sigma factor [Candidatus Sungbacteria bacterium]
MSLDQNDSQLGFYDEGQDGLKDEVLLHASADDPRLFEVIVRRYQEPFLRAATRIVRRREDAEDIVQEAFLKIYRNAGKFVKQENIEFKSWAYKVVLNTAFTHYQRLKKRGISEESDEALLTVGKDEHIEDALHTKMLLERVMADLPEDLAHVLRQHYIADKAYETIAGEERTTIASIKMRLYRARKAFKKLSDDKPSSIEKKPNHTY